MVGRPVVRAAAFPGAGARHSADRTARRSAVARVVVVSQNRKLLDRIDAESKSRRAARHIVGVVVLADTVNKMIILSRAAAPDADRRSETAAPAVGRTAIQRILSADCRDARLQQSELSPVTPVQRQFALGLSVFHTAQRGAFLFDAGSIRGRIDRGVDDGYFIDLA